MRLPVMGDRWPIVAAMGVLLVQLIVFIVRSLELTGDRFVYGLDDAYIHMAMARNLSSHGTWGVNDHEFSSSSSSILWTLLLSLLTLLVGAREWLPLALNILAAGAALAALERLLAWAKVAAPYRAVLLVVVIYAAPLGALVMGGMEHCLQLALDAWFLLALARVLEAEAAPLESRMLLVLAPLVTMVRYEGLFLIAPAVALMAARRKWRLAFAMAGLAALPILLFGTLSVALGSGFLPNSVVLKALRPDLHSWRGIWNFLVYTPYLRFVANPHVLAIFLLNLVLFIACYRPPARARASLAGVVATACYLHLMFASTGWYFRYEAYLVALGLATAAVAASHWLPTRVRMPSVEKLPRVAGVALAILLLAVPVGARGLAAQERTVKATDNIHDQQIQMGLFLGTYYRGESVAANDIGAVAFLGHVRCLDLWGLGSRDVAEARLGNRYTREAIGDLAERHGVRVAVVYKHWFEPMGGLPGQWQEVGTWGIVGNVVTGGDVVTFYAVEPSERDALIEHLREFGPRLPRDVVQGGNYTLAA